jgi:hypothetical protein
LSAWSEFQCDQNTRKLIFKIKQIFLLLVTGRHTCRLAQHQAEKIVGLLDTRLTNFSACSRQFMFKEFGYCFLNTLKTRFLLLRRNLLAANDHWRLWSPGLKPDGAAMAPSGMENIRHLEVGS